jgi:hypothetical protein
MRNKEIKKGDKVWLLSEYIGYEAYYTVVDVKKKGTLVSVIIESETYKKEKYEIVLYGHASSSILSGFDRKYGISTSGYTCDYDIVKERTEYIESYREDAKIGRAAKNLLHYLKV